MILLALSLAAAQAATATTPPPSAPPKVDCSDADHSAFDFWVGEWDVYDSKSNYLVAHSRIEKVAGGCAVKETFEQTVGLGNAPLKYFGTSYSALNRDGKWRQFYVDNNGGTSSYVGGMTDGAMILTTSGPIALRMTIARQPDGSVHQSTAVSRDGGTTWGPPGTGYTYRRRKA